MPSPVPYTAPAHQWDWQKLSRTLGEARALVEKKEYADEAMAKQKGTRLLFRATEATTTTFSKSTRTTLTRLVLVAVKECYLMQRLLEPPELLLRPLQCLL